MSTPAVKATRLPARTSQLVMVEQRDRHGAGALAVAPYILDRHGRRTPGHDDGRRTAQLRAGLTREKRVLRMSAQASEERLQEILAAVHEADYLKTLSAVDWQQPRIVPELAPPGLPADSPLWAGIVEVAFEGARAAISAADEIADGARFAYALCRPPGHHAGPAFLGGYCYLNNAAAAAHALCERGMGPVAIVDVDFHFPTGTRAIVAAMGEVSLGSLHASTLDEVPWREVHAGERERFVAFDAIPSEALYLHALQDMLEEFTSSSRAIVLSLGYDTVAGDPHGSWQLGPSAFARIGALLAHTGLPVCVVQEGGYSLQALAGCSHAFTTGLLDAEAIA